jgi:hypothetical protein
LYCWVDSEPQLQPLVPMIASKQPVESSKTKDARKIETTIRIRLIETPR